MPIGEAARRSGIAVSAIRYYEELGLLAAAGRSSGRRRFGEDAVIRLRIISVLQQAGFSLEEIRTLLRGGPDGARVRHQLVQAKLREVEQAIARLEAVATGLEAALSCGCDSLEHCPLVVPDGR